MRVSCYVSIINYSIVSTILGSLLNDIDTTFKYRI